MHRNDPVRRCRFRRSGCFHSRTPTSVYVHVSLPVNFRGLHTCIYLEKACLPLDRSGDTDRDSLIVTVWTVSLECTV
jgi:hypothetical protein